MNNIDSLAIFTRVARTRNMSVAARQLGLSPAVVSKLITQLEERYETRLFQRTTRQLTLTETGHGLFERAEEILRLEREAEDFVRSKNVDLEGVIRVTTPSAFHLLPASSLLPQFLEQYPGIKIELNLTDEFLDLINEGMDLAIRVAELPDSSYVARKLANNDRILCAAPSYLARHGTPPTIEALTSHNCVTMHPRNMWQLEGPNGLVNVKISGNLTCNSSMFINNALLAGHGIGLVSRWEVEASLQSGQLVQILENYMGSGDSAIYAVYPSRAFVPARLQLFTDFLAQAFSQKVAPTRDAVHAHTKRSAIVPADTKERGTVRVLEPAFISNNSARPHHDEQPSRLRKSVRAQ